jgi:uncharacterized membrane protein YjjP (DUF1212 family)
VTTGDEAHERRTRALLAQLGTAMIAAGQPVQEIEEELVELGGVLGYPDVQLAVGPTGLQVTLTEGGASTNRSAPKGLQLHQAASVRRIRYQLVRGELDPEQAREQLTAATRRPVGHPWWVVALAWPVLAVGIALILQPGWANVAAAGVGAVIVYGLVQLAGRYQVVTALLPTLAAFLVSLVVFGAANAGLFEGPLRTVLPPLAVLLPGALVVNGMSELAAGHMQAGSARLTYGLVQLGLFALGLLMATTLLRVPTSDLANIRVDEIGWGGAVVGLLLIGLSICLMEGVPLRMQGWVVLVLALAFSAQVAGRRWGRWPSVGSSGRSRRAWARAWWRCGGRSWRGSCCSCRRSGCSCRGASGWWVSWSWPLGASRPRTSRSVCSASPSRSLWGCSWGRRWGGLCVGDWLSTCRLPEVAVGGYPQVAFLGWRDLS